MRVLQSRSGQDCFQRFPVDGRGYGCEELSRLLKAPLMAVIVRVEGWEQQGLLARDERVSGIKYFRNIL
jgi:hypothetical protein